MEQAPCGCRFGSQDGAFVFHACHESCDLVDYVKRQSEAAGRPVHVVRLGDQRGRINEGTSAPIVTGFQTGSGVIVDRAMQGGVEVVAGFTVTLDTGQTFSGCAAPADCRGMIAALLDSAWKAEHPQARETTQTDVNELRDALNTVDPASLVAVIDAGRKALGL